MNVFIYKQERKLDMRRKDDALRDTLLHLARSIADTDGIDAINIRSLAGKAGVAAGTVYNYFSNKDEILLALTEEYWRQALLDMREAVTPGSFCCQLEEIFLFLRERIDQSAGRLMNSLGNVEIAGHARMMSMQSALESDFIQCMNKDPDVRRDIWSKDFTQEQFAHFIMVNLSVLLKEKAPDLSFFMTIVKRIIY